MPQILIDYDGLQQDHESFARAFMPWAKTTAAEIGRAVEMAIRNQRPRHPRKLLPLDENSLALLLVDILEEYICAGDDYDARYGAYDPETGEGRPPRIQSKLAETQPLLELPAGPDYGEDAGAGLPDWGEHWDRFHKRDRKSPGRNRIVAGGPPTALLYPAVNSLRNWYERQGQKFVIRYEWPEQISENAARCEALFLGVAEALDSRYIEENCKSVATNIRDPNRATRQRANRAAKKGLSTRN